MVLMKPHAMMCGAAIHTLVPKRWPAGDPRREWRWAAHVDGMFWRFFRQVGEWRREVAAFFRPEPRGPFAEATEHAVQWSEFEGRMLLDELRRDNLLRPCDGDQSLR